MTQIKQPFQRIGITGRIHHPKAQSTLEELIQFLHSLKYPIFLDTEIGLNLSPRFLALISQVPKENFNQFCDLLIVIGGDGSLLNAAHSAVNQDLPVLGINRGSLGFLTDILPHEIQKIGDILKGSYLLEKRFLLTATVYDQQKKISEEEALNEIALIPDVLPHMIEYEIFIEDQFVCSQHSDGLIISTPTGSTAYALSGGGPILHPHLDAVAVVPMCSHSLTSRPIVLAGHQTIYINITSHNKTTPRLSCDGRAPLSAPPGSQISIKKKKKFLHLIHPLDYNYYATLRAKLNWGQKLTDTE